MGRDWDFTPAVSRLPDQSMLYCGAQVGWDTSRDRQPRGACSVCRRPVVAEVTVGGETLEILSPDDPLPDMDLCVNVCGGCGRSHYDGTPAMDRAVKPSRKPEATSDIRDADRRTQAAVTGRKPNRKERRRLARESTGP